LFGIGATPSWAVPYDFDQSGFVDAPYAAPNPRLKIRSVKRRLYRGRCVNNEHIEKSLQAFRNEQDTIYGLIDTQAGLEPYARRDIVRFVDDFYELINDPRNVERRINRKCK
jgi:hypothetical protein